MGTRIRLQASRLFCLGLLILGATLSVSPATAQDFSGLWDSFSPLVRFPAVRAEVRGSPAWVTISQGTLTRGGGNPLDLRQDFPLKQGNFFIDTMGQVQVGRVAGRIHYTLRSFAGTTPAVSPPGQLGEARFDWSGIRLGTDLDLVNRNGVRVGVGCDYDLEAPKFSESIYTLGARAISGDPPVTMGTYVAYNPVITMWGASPIVEGRARWSIMGSDLTDAELSAGLKSPMTYLGALSLRGGYRYTSLGISDPRFSGGQEEANRLDLVMRCWFVQFTYHY
jgi:hypothetical protein